MWKIYFRQALFMLRQNMFISMIAILGTAVAIMMIMAIIVSDEAKSINIAPEVNRSRTLYITAQTSRDTTVGRERTGSVSYELIHEYIPRLEKPVKKGAVTMNYGINSAVLNVEGVSSYTNGVMRITNADYWDILQFDFTEGRPYNTDEVFSGIPYVVLSESMARKLFRDDTATGKKIEINFKPYTVIGVAKDVSHLFRHAAGDAWVPYTSNKEFTSQAFEVMLMGESEKDFPEIAAEVRKCERQYGKEKEPWQLYLRGPMNRKVYNMGLYGTNVSELESRIKEQNRREIFIFCILLLVPAINLSGISLSRIRRRTAEIGVRKAFGAKKYIILVQVLYENFITSLIGGILGLALSYIIIFGMKEWLLGIPAEDSVPLGSLVSPWIFVAVFLACMIINLLSAGLPAWKASRTTIINSLNQNDKQS